MNIKQITQRLDTLTALANEDKAKNTWLSGVVRMKIASNLNDLNKIYAAFEQKRMNLVKELGQPADGVADNFEIKDPDQLKKFHVALEPLLTENHEVDLEKISKKDLSGKSGDNQFSIGLIADLISLELIAK